jgi:hypothetical protein
MNWFRLTLSMALVVLVVGIFWDSWGMFKDFRQKVKDRGEIWEEYSSGD